MYANADASGLGLGPGLTFVGASTATGNSTTSVNVTVPAGVKDGDTILLHVAAYNTTISASGFTAVDSLQGNQAAVHKAASFIRTASGEGSTWTVSFGTASWVIVTAYVLRGAKPSPIANHGGVANASAYVTSMPPPTATVANATDGVVYAYMGVDSAGSGSETATLPGTLKNPLSAGNTSLGGVVAVGWGAGVSSPGNATNSPDGQDYMDTYMDLLCAGPFPPPCNLNQAVARAANW